jgi:hypothetical protein
MDEVRREYTPMGNVIVHYGDGRVMYLFLSIPLDLPPPFRSNHPQKIYKTNHWTKAGRAYHGRLTSRRT